MESKDFDYLVIGAGPAGCQLGHEFEQSKSSYVILESNDVPGSFFQTQPRHRTLLSVNKRFNAFPEADFAMRHDWNSLLCDDEKLLFKHYSKELYPDADDMCRYLRDFATRYQLNIKYKTRVMQISREDHRDGKWNSKFTINTDDGREYRCKVLINATGAVKENVPNIPGADLCDTYATHSLDKSRYESKRLVIIGGGNSAFETASYLADTCGFMFVLVDDRIKLAWDTHFVGDLRASNCRVLEMFHLKSPTNVVFYGTPQRIWKEDDGLLYVEAISKMPYYRPTASDWTWSFPEGHGVDHIILATGWKYVDEAIYGASARPETDNAGRYPVLTESWQSTVPDMFFAGTAMGAIDKRAASGFIHGFRYCCRALHQMLKWSYEDVPLPCHITPDINIERFIDAYVERTSTASGLYQLHQGFFADVYMFDLNSKPVSSLDTYDGTIRHIKEMPRQWLLQQEFFKAAPFAFVSYFEDNHNKFGGNTTTADFSNFPEASHQTSTCYGLIRPVISIYAKGQLKETLEMLGHPVVRLDMCLTRGDTQKRRIRNTIKNFLHKWMGIGRGDHNTDLLSPELEQKTIRPWSKQEVTDYHENLRQLEATKPCTFHAPE